MSYGIRNITLWILIIPATFPLAADEQVSGKTGWHDVKTERLGDLEVTLSAPVLVARREGYCWFPTLMQLSNGDLLAVMSNYHDDHVQKATSLLCWSADGGLTWSKPVEGLYSDSSVRKANGDQVLLPYYLRPRPGGAMGEAYQLAPQGKREATVVADGLHVGNWPRPDKSFSPQLGLSGFVFNGNTVEIKDGHLAMLYGYFKDTKRYSLVAVDSKDGIDWKVRSIVADENCPLTGAEGPCESATCRLKDGRLMCVFRMSSSDTYGQVFSEDEGKTWSKPQSMDKVGSVQPALAVMADGTLVLTGGRPGIFAWLSAAGDGKKWERLDLRDHHNSFVKDDPIGTSPGTSAYTEVVRLDDTHVLCIYDRLARGWSAIPKGSGQTNSVWVVRMTIGR